MPEPICATRSVRFDDVKQQRATRAPGDCDKCCIGVWVRAIVGPYQLAGIYLEHGQHTRDQAYQHGRQEDVTPGVAHFFRKGRNTVEADIRQHGNRSTC